MTLLKNNDSATTIVTCQFTPHSCMDRLVFLINFVTSTIAIIISCRNSLVYNCTYFSSSIDKIIMLTSYLYQHGIKTQLNSFLVIAYLPSETLLLNLQHIVRVESCVVHGEVLLIIYKVRESLVQNMNSNNERKLKLYIQRETIELKSLSNYYV